MITDQLKSLTEAVAKSLADRSISISIESWVHLFGSTPVKIRLALLPGLNGDNCTHVYFRDEAELAEWINNGCDTSVVYLDADGLYMRVPELQVFNNDER